MQKAFDGVPGVASVTAGYAGGTLKRIPGIEQVETGRTGYAESVQVIYEPAKITYDSLLEIYWHHIDPTTPNRRSATAGPQYRSIIFYGDPTRSARRRRRRRRSTGRAGSGRRW